MASPKSVAIRRNEALGRLQAAASDLCERLSLPAPDLRVEHRNPDIARAMELEAVAGLLENVVSSLPSPVSPATAPKKATK